MAEARTGTNATFLKHHLAETEDPSARALSGSGISEAFRKFVRKHAVLF